MTRLLIVDDNEQNLYMLQVLLKGHGYQVVSARDGAEALGKARRDPPDVIITDILMPVMDGFTLCREWKKDEVLKAIPFVFYTATYTDSKDEEFALSLGAERFIVKPVEPDVFVGMLREVIEEVEVGQLVAPREPVEEEAIYFKEYNEALIRKLEDKMVQLEEANRALEGDIAERVRAEWALGERVKELTCLYAVSRDMQEDLSIDELCRRVMEHLVPAMQFPEITVPVIELDDRRFTSERYSEELSHGLHAEIRVGGEVCGRLWVYYAEERPFLIPEEQNLVNSIAEALGRWLERKRAEEELQRLYEQAQRDAETKAILLDEVNHRVKNNLLAIVGLLHTERRYAEMADQAAYRAIMQNLINRVGGLTTVHSLLSASEWVPMPLSDLAGQVVRSSLQILPRHKGLSVEVTPSPVRVTPDQAHSLALVINELATNTVRHALEERDTAHIAVGITREDNTVRFEFRDDGPGYPEDVLRLERYSVGFDLIQNMVRTGLRGELSLYDDDGAVAVIRFKAEA